MTKIPYKIFAWVTLLGLLGCFEDFDIEGPRIKNGFQTPIKIHILFQNEEIQTRYLLAGENGSLGIQGMRIEKVQIYQNEVLKIEIPNPQFPTKENLKRFKDNPREVWIIDQNGIHPSIPK